ncbi:MAG: RagB/SusD family nutrient uptake outer membrane protein [Bacteroidales bacterium]
MMKMKIIIAGLLTILLGSCSEDFLTIPSKESLTTAVYFESQKDFEYTVNGIYAALRGWYGQAGNNTSPLFIMGDIHSDLARYTFNPNFRATQGVEEPADFVPIQQMFSGYWNDFYQWISSCNQVIGYIDDVDMDADVKSNLKGQALFLRAHSYWWLLKLYGNAVIHLEPVTTLDQTSKPLSPEADVKAQILADASEAASLLPDKANQEPGRVTKGTAYMLQADLHMWYGEWAEAETALKNITGYSLVADYADVFDPGNKNNEESVWEIQFSAQSSDYASTFVYQMFPRPFSPEKVAEYTGVSNPNSLGQEQYVVPTPELLATYEDGDSRYEASIMFVENDDGWLLPMCSKYLHPHSTMSQCDDNLPIYRYAEVLLYLAEAANEQGKTSEAQGYLNEVRTRAGLPNSTASSQDDLRDAIMAERMVELAFEGKRWWDLVRTGTALEVVSAYGASVKADPESYYFPVGYGPVPTAFTDIVTVFNIPNDEIRLNPEID